MNHKQIYQAINEVHSNIGEGTEDEIVEHGYVWALTDTDLVVTVMTKEVFESIFKDKLRKGYRTHGGSAFLGKKNQEKTG